MEIQIHQTFARIGIETTPRRMDMETTQARLELRSKRARVDIQTDLPRVEIDSTECWNTSGRKNNSALMREAAQNGMQAAAAYTSKVAGDGDSLAMIENPSNPIPSFAERDAFPQHEFNIDYMPKARPQITVKGGVKFTPVDALGGALTGVSGEYIPGTVKYNFVPAQVRTYIAQKASLQIEYVGKNIDVSK